MSVYLDASVIVPLFTVDFFTDRARNLLRGGQAALIVSDFAGAEFVSALARRVRTGEMTPENARAAFSAFDDWGGRIPQREEVNQTDIRDADGFLRRLDLTLRTPDALNIAIARRTSAILATFDDDMAKAACALGVAVAEI